MQIGNVLVHKWAHTDLEEGALELLQAAPQTQPRVKLHSFALRKFIPELLTFNTSLSTIPHTGKLNISCALIFQD